MVKKLFFACLLATRIMRLIAWCNRRRVTILCYHGVTQDAGARFYDPHKQRLPVKSFERQLDYLQARYHIISLAEFVAARSEGRKLPDHTAVLTFDDGHRNFLTVAAPLLLQRRLPCTSFIITGPDFTSSVSNQNPKWTIGDDTAYLSWPEVKQLANRGITFGSHTSAHAALPDVSPSEAVYDLEQSLNSLKTNLGTNSFPLAYPHGRTSDRINDLAKTVGYSCALTTVLGQNGRDCDLFTLRRVVIASDDDLPSFAARVSGLTSWYARISEWLKGERAAAGRDFESETPVSETCTVNEMY